MVVTTGFFMLGWALHYFPFFLMGRILFLHHYLPALIFSYLAAASSIDFCIRFERPFVRSLIMMVLLAAWLSCFVFFSPLAYGTSMTKAEVQQRKWLKDWDLHYA